MKHRSYSLSSPTITHFFARVSEKRKNASGAATRADGIEWLLCILSIQHDVVGRCSKAPLLRRRSKRRSLPRAQWLGLSCTCGEQRKALPCSLFFFFFVLSKRPIEGVGVAKALPKRLLSPSPFATRFNSSSLFYSPLVIVAAGLVLPRAVVRDDSPRLRDGSPWNAVIACRSPPPRAQRRRCCGARRCPTTAASPPRQRSPTRASR